jgi:hypothetical protein
MRDMTWRAISAGPYRGGGGLLRSRVVRAAAPQLHRQRGRRAHPVLPLIEILKETLKALHNICILMR